MTEDQKSPEMPRTRRRVGTNARKESISLDTIGGRIAFSRLSREMTQGELGQLIGKGRPTIVQYESNAIVPPISVIAELSAKLAVQPEFLAFGRYSLDFGDMKIGNDLISIPEIHAGNDGDSVSGGHVLPTTLLMSMGVAVNDLRDIKAFVLTNDAPAFGMGIRTRLYVHTKVTEIVSGRKYYLLRTANGLEIVRAEPAYTTGPPLFTGGNGSTFSLPADELDFIGAVVGSIAPV